MSGGIQAHLNSAIASWRPEVTGEDALGDSLQSSVGSWMKWRAPFNQWSVDGQVRYFDPGTLSPYLGVGQLPFVLATRGETDLETVATAVEELSESNPTVFLVLLGYDEERVRSTFEGAGGDGDPWSLDLDHMRPDAVNLWLWERVEDVGTGDPAILPGEGTARGASLQASGSVSTIFDR